MDERERLEGMQEAMRGATSMTVTRFVCVDCERAYDRRPAQCFAENHAVHAKERRVWAFRCGACKHRILHDREACVARCAKCGEGTRWVADSVHNLKVKTDEPGLVAPLLARGEEQANSLRF
jgi:hypothetical protein